jgi:hypothetical protein
MQTKIENGVLTITVPLDAQPKVSTSGKSFLLVNTSGFMKTGLTHQGKPVSLSLNVIVPVK